MDHFFFSSLRRISSFQLSFLLIFFIFPEWLTLNFSAQSFDFSNRYKSGQFFFKFLFFGEILLEFWHFSELFFSLLILKPFSWSLVYLNTKKKKLWGRNFVRFSSIFEGAGLFRRLFHAFPLLILLIWGLLLLIFLFFSFLKTKIQWSPCILMTI